MEGIETNEYRLRANKAAKDNGGADFPEPGSAQCEGMSLRDYFAAKANEKDIVDMIHSHFLSEHARNHNEYVPLTRQQARYAHADAMLAERAK